MTRSATRNLVIGLGILLFVLDVIQDISYVTSALRVTGWSGRLVAEIVSLTVRNGMLAVGLSLVFFRLQSGWTLLALLSLFTLVRRMVWFVASESAFGSIDSPAFQGAYSAADLIFRLLCLTVLVDLVRDARRAGPRADRGDAPPAAEPSAAAPDAPSAADRPMAEKGSADEIREP